MKNLLLLLCCLTVTNAMSQFDYFTWKKNNLYNPVGALSFTNGIAVDQYERIFYINSSDFNHIYWQYGRVLNTSAKASSSSNLIHIADFLGDHLYYIRDDKKIGLIEYLYSNNTWTANNSYSITDQINTQIGINAIQTNQVFYARLSDNKLCSFWKTPNTSGFGPLNINAPSVSNGSNILINGNRVYYITINRTIGCLEWNGVSWAIISLPNSPSNYSLKINSKIQVYGNNINFSIFYINTNNKICQYYNNTNTNIGSGFGVISESAPNAFQMTNIFVNSYDECRYLGVDGNYHSLFWNGCSWTFFKLTNSNNINFPNFSQLNNKLYYFNNSGFVKLYNISESSGFVYKKRDKLFLNNSQFNPIGINYIATIYSLDGGNTLFAGPDGHYSNNFTNTPCSNQSNCQSVFDQNLSEISSLGFNSIRFNGLQLYSNPNDYNDPELYIYYKNPSNWWSPRILKKIDQNFIITLFNFYDNVLNKASINNLKVKFFIGLENGNRNTNCQVNYTEFLKKFALHFKNNKTIYSYAIFQEADNEPRVNETASSSFRGKGDICYYVNNHYDAIRSIDSNHLINISLMNSLSLLSFDPQILNVDFLSFHPYPDFNNLQDNTFESVRRQIQWISNVMKKIDKPWIIGETGFPGYSLNSSIQQTGTFIQQKDYAKFVLDEAFSAGACGVAWWQFRDVFWTNPQIQCCIDPILTSLNPSIQYWYNYENYFGLKSHNGVLKPFVGGIGLPNTSNVFLNYNVNNGCSCIYPSNNYYLTIQNPSYSLTGTVIGVNNIPIKDALVIGWDINSNSNSSTFTKSDGSFIIQSNTPFFEIKIAALGHILSNSIYYPVSNKTYKVDPVICGQNLKNSEIDNLDSILTQNNKFTIVPNPSNGHITIETNIDNFFNIEVLNQFGQLMFFEENLINNSKVDLSNLNKGVYIIIVKTETFIEKLKIITY